MEAQLNLLQEANEDLRKRYTLHRATVVKLWRSFSQDKRAKLFKCIASHGQALEDRDDESKGIYNKLVPELNIKDIATDAEFFLDIFKYRATNSLLEQYEQGPSGDPGDGVFIVNSIRMNQLPRSTQSPAIDDFVMFGEGELYGRHVADLRKNRHNSQSPIAQAIETGQCLPLAAAKRVLQRQAVTINTCKFLIDRILDADFWLKMEQTSPIDMDELAQTMRTKLSIEPDGKNLKLSLQDLLVSAIDQRTAVDDQLKLLRTNPMVLEEEVRGWFFSKPELIKDTQGRDLPNIGDKYISTSTFDCIHNAVGAAAAWNCICHLLQLLIDAKDDKLYRNILFQELSNVCHLEHGRVYRIFKRHLQSSNLGKQYFRRVPDVFDNVVARVNMVKTGPPDSLMKSEAQLYLLLKLCQANTNAENALPYIQKLDSLYRNHSREQHKLTVQQWDSFCDLAVIVGFTQSLSKSQPLPSHTHNKGQAYVSRSKEVAEELVDIRAQVDLSDFAAPISILKFPGKAEAALAHLDKVIREKTGTKIGFLYQDMVEESIAAVKAAYLLQKTTLEQRTRIDYTLPTVEQPSSAARVQQRREKDKSRPTHSSVFEIIPNAPALEVVHPVEITTVFRVKQSTFEVFSTLFSKSEARGFISWVAFAAAMVDLDFSIVPKDGSIYTFSPPEDFGVRKSITLHRPHKSKIENYLLVIFASRLHRVYGWSAESFRAD